MKKEFPLLETKRTKLRNLTHRDSDELYRYYANPELYRYLDWSGPQSEHHAEEIIESFRQGFEEGWIIRWAIEDKETGRLIGTCFLSEFQDDVKAEIGYELSQEFWNRGIMSEVVERVLVYGFEQLSLVRIQALCNPDNRSSQKLLEKNGFQQEGLLRKYEYHTESKKLSDVFIYSRLCETKSSNN